MKKTILIGFIALALIAISSPSALWAAVEVDTPDLPSNFWNIAVWPITPHTGSCIANGKEYRSTAYARIVVGNKIESVLATSIDGKIFRYQHAGGNRQQPDFGIDFIRSGTHWVRFNLMNEYSSDLFEDYIIKQGISIAELNDACKDMSIEFRKFWDELFNEVGIER